MGPAVGREPVSAHGPQPGQPHRYTPPVSVRPHASCNIHTVNTPKRTIIAQLVEHSIHTAWVSSVTAVSPRI